MHPSSRSEIRAARVPAASIAAIAEAAGAPKLEGDAARAIASDVEYRLRQIFQDAVKCMRHSKRSTLCAEVRAAAGANARVTQRCARWRGATRRGETTDAFRD
jgi:histone H3/H4